MNCESEALSMKSLDTFLVMAIAGVKLYFYLVFALSLSDRVYIACVCVRTTDHCNELGQRLRYGP